MKSISTFIFTILLSIPAVGQNAVIDSLKTLLASTDKPTEEIDFLNEISYNFNFLNLDSTYHYATIALNKAKKINYQLGEARSLNLQGSKFMFEKKHEQALALNEEALIIATIADDHKMMGKIYNSLGINYYSLGDKENCLVNLRKAFRQSELAKDSSTTIIIGSNIGYMYLKNGDLDLAEQYLERADELNNEFKTEIGVNSVQKHLASLYGLQGKDEKAIEYFSASLKKAKETNDKFSLGWNYLQLAKFQKKRNDLQQAEKNLLLSNKNFEERNDLENRLEVLTELSEVLNLQKQFSRSESYALVGLELANVEGNIDHKKNLFEQLSISKRGKGEHDQAYEYLQKYIKWNDSLHVLDKSERILELESVHQLEKSKVENKLLKEEQAKQEAIIKQGNIQNIASLIFLAFISVFAFLLYRNNKRKQEYSLLLESEVEQRTQDLRTTNTQLLQSNEELERFAFIASHDLKEPIRNILSFTDLLQKEFNGTQGEKANKIINIIQKNTTQLYSLVRDTLEFSMLSNEDKTTEVVDLNETLESVRSSIANTLEKKNADILIENDLPKIKANKTQMFLVFKNLIENGLKYNESENPQISIGHRSDSSKDTFSFRDNGIGIDKKYSDKIFDMFSRLQKREGWEGTGLGLATCKKIIDQMGGNIWLENKPEKGSTFMVSIPYS